MWIHEHTQASEMFGSAFGVARACTLLFEHYEPRSKKLIPPLWTCSLTHVVVPIPLALHLLLVPTA